MCGRYVSTTDAEGLVRFLVVDDRDPAARIGEVRWTGAANHNVAPTDQVPAVVRDDGQLVLTGLRWGLVPFWADDLKIGARMINARAETIAEKRAFAQSFEQRRCLIPADGFYEWERRDGKKLPWLIHRTDGDPMVFAGVWSSWTDRSRPSDDPARRVLSCSIITTRANGILAPIHDRMPAVLDRDGWAAWLDPASDVGDLRELLGPAPDDDVERHRVSTRVNSVANDDPTLIQPVPDHAEPAVPGTPQPGLFDIGDVAG